MAETLENACVHPCAKKWHWYNIEKDLVEQGGIESKDITINPLTVNPSGCGGEHAGNYFYITWAPDMYLLVSSKQYDPALINAFAKVVEYKPFVKYKEPDSELITTEWDKIDPVGRFKEIQELGKLDITRLE